MKKILIVNNNLDMGGIQKSLINLIRAKQNDYSITLLLFSQSGCLMKDIPKGVRVITPRKIYSILGLSREELKKSPLLFIAKAFFMKYASLFSRRSAMKLLGIFQKKLTGYDLVISYSHLPNHKYFANGCGDFVLDRTVCRKKICMIHCDYTAAGYMTEQNNAEYNEFDEIVCCSDSVRQRFIQGSSMNPEKVRTLRNFYDFSIIESAKRDTYPYDEQYINLVSVARLSREKGIDRVIEALHNANRLNIRYYIIGDGPQKKYLSETVSGYHMESRIFFVGEQKNPYRYMMNADYLLVPSLHEAAPIVFDEAHVLGLKIISTDTTSAEEMVGDSGIICENSLNGIETVLRTLTKNAEKKKMIKTNQLQERQLEAIVG